MNKTFNRSRDDKPGSYRTHYDCKYTIDKHKMLSLILTLPKYSSH